MHWTTYPSPLGPLRLEAGPSGLARLRFPDEGGRLDDGDRAPEAFTDAVEQLDAYFAGDPRGFELPLDLHGTPFQRAVWDALLAVPHGTTTTYAALARAVGRPDRARAVGAAVGRTPVPIVVPCHRVVGSDGALRGYRGGLERKRALLALEAGARPSG
jgi:methylated-DNA-[protein]-cysteine S-methyltransferase